MGIGLREAGLDVHSEVEVHALFRGHSVGVFRLDFVVGQSVIVELKAARGIDQSHLAQVLNYLRCTSLETGLILNFGPRPQIKRVAFTNSRKPHPISDSSQHFVHLRFLRSSAAHLLEGRR